jgi:hypothetical protein
MYVAYAGDYMGALKVGGNSIFNQAVGGQPLEVRGLYKDPEDLNGGWKCPFAVASQIPPTGPDNGSALVRRLMLIQLIKRFGSNEVNTSMPRTMEKQGLLMLIYCNRIYKAGLGYIREKNVWNTLPNYFHDQRKMVSIDNDTLCGCIDHYTDDSDGYKKLVIDPDLKTLKSPFDSDYYIGSKQLEWHYLQYCNEKRRKPEPWRLNAWASALIVFNLGKMRSKRPNHLPEKKKLDGEIFFGIAEATSEPYIIAKKIGTSVCERCHVVTQKEHILTQYIKYSLDNEDLITDHPYYNQWVLKCPNFRFHTKLYKNEKGEIIDSLGYVLQNGTNGCTITVVDAPIRTV